MKKTGLDAFEEIGPKEGVTLRQKNSHRFMKISRSGVNPVVDGSPDPLAS